MSRTFSLRSVLMNKHSFIPSKGTTRMKAVYPKQAALAFANDIATAHKGSRGFRIAIFESPGKTLVYLCRRVKGGENKCSVKLTKRYRGDKVLPRWVSVQRGGETASSDDDKKKKSDFELIYNTITIEPKNNNNGYKVTTKDKYNKQSETLHFEFKSNKEVALFKKQVLENVKIRRTNGWNEYEYTLGRGIFTTKERAGRGQNRNNIPMIRSLLSRRT